MISLHDNKSILKQLIEFIRKELIRVGTEEGLSSEKALKIADELDIYIAKYQILKKGN